MNILNLLEPRQPLKRLLQHRRHVIFCFDFSLHCLEFSILTDDLFVYWRYPGIVRLILEDKVLDAAGQWLDNEIVIEHTRWNEASIYRQRYYRQSVHAVRNLQRYHVKTSSLNFNFGI